MSGEYVMQEDLTLFNKFLYQVEKGAKCFCGEKLLRENLDYYPHEGGIMTVFSKNKQWVYITCKCGYQMSWKKLLGRYM